MNPFEQQDNDYSNPFIENIPSKKIVENEQKFLEKDESYNPFLEVNKQEQQQKVVLSTPFDFIDKTSSTINTNDLQVISNKIIEEKEIEDININIPNLELPSIAEKQPTNTSIDANNNSNPFLNNDSHYDLEIKPLNTSVIESSSDKEYNPFLEDENKHNNSINTSNNNNNNNNNNSTQNTFFLLNQLESQRDEFSKKEKYTQDKLSQIIKEKNDLDQAITLLNEKYMEIMRQNEDLKQNRIFIKENIQLFINNEANIPPSLSSSTSSNSYHFNFAHEIKQLYKYKSLEDKSILLRNTVKTLNNDNILMVCQFLYETLREKLFLNEISKYPNLIDLFFGHLRRLGKFNDIIQLQKHLKIIHEEIYISLYMALNEIDLKKKRQLLFQWVNQYKSICLPNQSSPTPSNQFSQYPQYIQHIDQYLGLLERQSRIDEFDSQQALKGDPIYIKYPRCVLMDKTMNDTLYYMYLYHSSASKDKLSSPLSLKESFEISEKLILLNQLKARSFIADWNQVKDIMPKRKGIFSKTYQCEIGIEGFTEILIANNAPFELIEQCVRMLDDEQKYNFSIQYSLYQLALEALLNLKSLKKSNEFKMLIEKQITSNPSLLSLIESLNQQQQKSQKSWK